MLAPSVRVPRISHGPITQPMSVTHSMRSPASTSKQVAMSVAILSGKPPCVATTPFGRPVVPEVYITSAASSDEVCASTGGGPGVASLADGHQWSRPSVHGVSGVAGVAPVVRRGAAARHDEHAAHRRAAELDRVIGGLLHRDPRAAAEERVRGDQDLRLGVGEPGRDRLGAVAREARHRDRAELQRREQRRDGLGQHRQEQRDAIAVRDAERRQRARRSDRPPPRARRASGCAARRRRPPRRRRPRARAPAASGRGRGAPR